jgi:hypothetical protein
VPADWFGEIVMTTASVVGSHVDAPRPRPNPGYRVAPRVADAYAPWVSALDDSLESGEYRWIVGTDGALVPTPVSGEEDAPRRPKRRLWGRRTE